MGELWSRRGWLQSCGGVLGSLAAPAVLARAAVTVAPPPLQPRSLPMSWPAWEAFKIHFISDAGRVTSNDENGGQTYSEAQAYVLFFALVANDRAAFDTLLQWTENNLCAGDMTARLPAWLWGKKPDGSWGVVDSNPASDADLWIAYALGEAGRLWDVRRYRALSALLAARALREETADLPGLGLSLLPAPVGFDEGPGRWRLNPSYLPLPVMHWLAAREPESAWGAVAGTSLQIILRSAPQGFSPDWTVYDVEKGFTVYAEGLKGQGAYNAIRVYTWAGMMHPDATGRRALLAKLAPMAAFVRDQGFVPESIDILRAQASGPGPSGFSAAMMPFLQARDDQAALQAQRQRLAAKPLRPDAYYEQMLGLFGLGWMEGRFQFSATGHLLPRWNP